jgi:pantoate--beta-alanine ligase
MKIADSIESLISAVKQWREQGLRIGFVPTMGNLHAGHIALVKAARLKCDRVVVSIFVNPLQFNEADDFAAYPKTLQEDQDKLEHAQTDLLFLPGSETIYPEGQALISKVSVPVLSDILEGECRPGHFDGVATVVNKLFNLVRADIAFFGQKDYQQLLVIQKMVKDLGMPVQIVSVPTQREKDGLAMSSRNSRLTAEQRERAAQLHKVLRWLADELQSSIESVAQLEQRAILQLERAGFQPEYVSLRSASTLQPVSRLGRSSVLLAAARLGDVRLIDNLVINQ